MNKILHLKESGKSHEACHLYHSFQRELIHGTRASDVSQNSVISDISCAKSGSSISFVNPVQYYLNLTSQQGLHSTEKKN
jgi:hypothetical protein